MEEISNRSLAVLLVVAIVVSIGGSFMSLSKLKQAPTTIYVDQGSPTGFATNPTGNTTVTITTNSELIFRVGTLDFGSGYVYANSTFCNMTSRSADPSSTHFSSGCSGFTGAGFNAPLVLENTGNTNFSVTLASNATAAEFIGGTSTTPLFQWRIIPGTAEARTGEAGDDTSASCSPGWRNQSVYTTVNDTSPGTLICGDGTTKPFSSSNDQDEAIIDVFIRIPSDALGANKKAIITATGTA